MLMFSITLFLPETSAESANKITNYVMPNTQIIPIKDSKSNKQYELIIKLPENYADNQNKQYPVIYFTDAVWHIELMSSATTFMMKDVILVGVSWQKDINDDVKQQYGEHFSRFGDYSFKKTANPKHPKIKFGQAKSHLAFIRQDVFNYVESNYRADPKNRTYFGFSMGGLFGTYALMAQPSSFKNYILGSPSIWKSGTALFALQSKNLKNKALNINVFISYGELEEELRPYVDKFIEQLKSKKYQAISSIKHSVIGAAGHSDSSPLMAPQSIQWLASLQPQEKK